MDNGKLQPRNIFEQILFGQLAVNNNIVALSKNIEILNDRFDGIMDLFAAQTALETKHNEVKEDESLLNN